MNLRLGPVTDGAVQSRLNALFYKRDGAALHSNASQLQIDREGNDIFQPNFPNFVGF